MTTSTSDHKSTSHNHKSTTTCYNCNFDLPYARTNYEAQIMHGVINVAGADPEHHHFCPSSAELSDRLETIKGKISAERYTKLRNILKHHNFSADDNCLVQLQSKQQPHKMPIAA